MEVKTEQFLRGKHVVVTVLELFLAFPRRLAFPMSVSEVLTSGLLLYTSPKSFSLALSVLGAWLRFLHQLVKGVHML